MPGNSYVAPIWKYLSPYQSASATRPYSAINIYLNSKFKPTEVTLVTEIAALLDPYRSSTKTTLDNNSL